MVPPTHGVGLPAAAAPGGRCSAQSSWSIHRRLQRSKSTILLCNLRTLHSFSTARLFQFTSTADQFKSCVSAQALGAPFSEQLTHGPPGGAAAHPAAGAAAPTPPRPVRSMRLRGLSALAALDAPTSVPNVGEAPSAAVAAGGVAASAVAAAGPAAADPPGLVLVPGVAGFGSGSGGGGGETEAGGSGFHAVLCSAYLARLAAAGAERSGGGGEGGEEGSVSSRVTQVAGGLSIAYSFAAGAGFSECRLCRSMTCLRNAMSCWLRGACWTSLSCSSRRDLHRAPPDSAHARQTVLSPDIQMILVPKPKRESQHTTIAGCWCS